MRQTDLAKTLTHFLSQYLPGQRNVSTNTIKSYRDTFKQLLTFCDSELHISPEYLTLGKIKAEIIQGFLTWLEKSKGISINTRNQRLAAIHSFYRYAQAENPEIMFECQKILSIPFKKRQIKTINYLQQDTLKLLFQQPDMKTQKGRRDLTMMVLLYDTGARVQELIDLKVGDIRLAKPATVLLTGKGNKKRYVPIMGKTCELLKQYMEENHLLDNGKQDCPLFYNNSRQPFTRPGVTYILEKNLKKAKELTASVPFPDKLKPHMLRHTKAINLLEAGVNLIYIRDFLGHVSITTTERYARTNSEIKRKALESVYMEVVRQDVPIWDENTDLMNWLQEFCR
ncbi:MAG TPA: integrase [Nitrospiraceae bacterium]|nr:integrase [Nitrospiraceae bacterium]